MPFHETKEQRETRRKTLGLHNHSIFHITINSNKAFRSEFDREEFEPRFIESIVDMFRQSQVGEIMLDMESDANPIDTIENYRATIGKEYGKKVHRLHVHCIIRISHNAHLQFDKFEMGRILKKDLERWYPKNTHPRISIQGSRDKAEELLEYALKDLIKV